MEEIAFGDIEFSGEDSSWEALKYDKLAFGAGGCLMFVSLVGDTGLIKGIRAYLNTNKKVTITANGGRVKRASAHEAAARHAGVMTRAAEGYRTEYHRLEYGSAHALFITKAPGFLLSTDEEAVWQELNTDRFTTPLVREWMPWLMTALAEEKFLVEAECYRCKCGELTCTSESLDRVVGEGIRAGHLTLGEAA